MLNSKITIVKAKGNNKIKQKKSIEQEQLQQQQLTSSKHKHASSYTERKQQKDKTTSGVKNILSSSRQKQNLPMKNMVQQSPIKFVSLEIVKPDIDTSYYKKLNISLIITEMTDDSRKLIRLISSKFSMNLYDNWQKFWNKQKELLKQRNNKGATVSNGSNMGDGELIIIDQSCTPKILRQMKLNPSLRVILLLQKISLQDFQMKQQYSFMFITDIGKEIWEYLTNPTMKKRLILTSKG